MLDIHYENKIYLLPENWNELSKKQLIQVSAALHSNKNAVVVELEILRVLLNMSKLKFCFLSNDVIHRLIPLIQWIAEDEHKLTENLIPSYQKNIFCKKLYGPENEFNNLLMVEFHYTEVAYYFLVQTTNERYLDELVAILYRSAKANYDHKRNSEGDVRVPFNNSDIIYHQKIVSKWSMAVKQSILMWYNGCRQMLVEDYPFVYGGKPSNDNSNYFAGLYNMMRSIAGEKYGTIDKVEQLTVHTAHLELTCIIEDANKLEQAYKKQA